MGEKYIPFFIPSIDNKEIREVAKVMKSGWITSGHVTESFEKIFKKYIGCKYAAAVNSGTAALHLALDAINLKFDDEVITSPMTFAATAEVILYYRAKPVFVDCRLDTFNIDEKCIEEKITHRTRAIIPVHYAGQPCRMDSIMDIGRKYGLKVIVDAAHAIPAKFKGKSVGTIGDLTAFSFYANKNITTGEGGMVSTDNEQFINHIKMMRLHGISQDAWKRYQRGSSWQYEIYYPGFKYNLTDIASAIGIVQLDKCEELYNKRIQIVKYYLKQLQNVEEIKLPWIDPDVQHAWHLFVVQLNLEKLKITREKFVQMMHAKNIGTSVHFIPLHLHPFYRETFNYKPQDFPNAHFLSERIVSLPLYPKMTAEDMHRVVKSVIEIIATSRKTTAFYLRTKYGIPLSNPDITPLERQYVNEVLQTPYLSLGPKLEEFEEKVAHYLDVRYTVAVNSGTSALHMALRAYELGAGDEVITTPFSFVSSATCLLFEKIKPIFIDIDDKYYNLDPYKVEQFLKTRTKEERSHIKAILAVDVFGHPANWNALTRIAKKYNLILIEDSSEALGSEYKLNPKRQWKKAGTIGDIGIISFYPNKQITTGEGGLVVTNNKHIAEKCQSMRNQGRNPHAGKENIISTLGYNYRLSDINCALGSAQMERLEVILENRRKVAEHYTNQLKVIKGIHVPQVAHDVKLSWFVYVIRLDSQYGIQERDYIITQLAKQNIACGKYFPSIHLQPVFVKQYGYKRGDYPVSEHISDRTIALPFFNNLKKHEIELVVNKLQNIIKSM
jgi:perosamine synthetase